MIKKRISWCLIILIVINLLVIEIPSVMVRGDSDNIFDLDLIQDMVLEKGLDINQSDIISAIELNFRDLVVKGDGIQGNILSTTKPVPVSISLGFNSDENTSLTSKTSLYVSVLIAADEEYVSLHPDWQHRTLDLVEKVDDYFINKFGLDFIITGFEEYYSNNDLTSPYYLFNDVIGKVSKKDANIMIAFCGQYTGKYQGLAELNGDDVIIFNVPSHWLTGDGEDNVVQHELSHLFNAEDHDPGFYDWCIMSYAWNPYTYTWCDKCYNSMREYINVTLIQELNWPLVINMDKQTYTTDEIIYATIHNIGDETLALMKWYIEKQQLGGSWEIIYESTNFTNNPIFFPIGDQNLSNIDTTFNLTDSSLILSQNLSGIGITSNLTDSSLIWDYENNGETIPWTPPQIGSATFLEPNQKLTLTLPKIKSKGTLDFGEYRIKINYGKYAYSKPFSIVTTNNNFSIIIINLTRNINFENSLTTDLELGQLSINETPSIVYNFSSSNPIVDSIVKINFQPIEITLTSDLLTGKTFLNVQNVTAMTMKPLKIYNSTLLMSTSFGDKQIKITPNMVEEKAKLSYIKEIELEETNGKPMYQIKGTRETNILWFIPSEMEVKVYLNAETGEIEDTEKPWWGFLAS